MFTLSAAAGWFSCDYDQKYYEAGRCGFKAMEDLGWANRDLDRIKTAIRESGVVPSCLLFQSKDEKTASLIANSHGIVWEDAHDAFIQSIEETVAAAKYIGCPNIVVTTGNERTDVSRYVQHTNVVTALRAAAPLLKGTGVRIVLEPLNVLVDHGGYYLATSDETAEVIAEVGSPDVLMLFDVYHQQITEGNIIANIRKHISKIGHFHVADVPGRREPGTGELNYRNIFKAIAETGYQGFVAFECGRSKDAETVCAEMLSLM